MVRIFFEGSPTPAIPGDFARSTRPRSTLPRLRNVGWVAMRYGPDGFWAALFGASKRAFSKRGEDSFGSSLASAHQAVRPDGQSPGPWCPTRRVSPRSTLPRLRYGGRHIGLAPAARPRHGRPVGPRPVRPRPGCGACRLFLAAATFDPVPPRPVRSGSAASGLWDVRVVECTAGLRGGGRFPSARRRPPEPLVGPASTFHPPPLCRPLAPVTFLPLGPRPRPPPSESPDWSVPATRPVRHLPDGAVRFVRTPRRPLLQKNPDFARPISAHPDIGANRDDSRETRTLRFRPEPCVERRF